METLYEFQRKCCYAANSRWAPKVLLSTLFFFTFLLCQAQVLIPYQSNWRYAPESSTPLPTTVPNWNDLAFNDNGWKGVNPLTPAPFGFGSIHSGGTVLLSRPDPNASPASSNKNYPVYYFRKKFNVADKGAISGLGLTVKYDDAVEVFLNGQKVADANMVMNTTPGEEAYFGSPPISSTPGILTKNLGTTDLVNGENVIVVALHQGGSLSSDVYFDLQLEGIPVAGGALIPYKSNWRYAPESSTPLPTTNPNWNELAYNDNGWNGVNPLTSAPFGFGNYRTTTKLESGPDQGHYPIYYFRKTIDISNLTAYSGFKLKAYYDDGIVVYVNGQEVIRENAPAGTGYTGTAGDSVTVEKNLSTSLFNAGQNVIAVELRQRNAGSSDILFDLQLEAISSASIVLTRYPYLQLASHDQMSVWWYTNIFTSSTVRYSTNADLSNPMEAIGDNGILHAVKLTGLQPNTRYYYVVGHGTGNDFVPLQNNTSLTNFRTLSTNTSQPLRFWLLGDSGAGKIENPRPYYVRDAYLNYLAAHGNPHVDGILFLGDNSNGQGVEGEQEALDRTLFKFYNQPGINPEDKQLLSKIPSWTVMGNHDYNLDPDYVINGTSYDIRKSYHKQIAASFSTFAFPENGEIGGVKTMNKKGYYSFDQGDVHFVVLNPYIIDETSGFTLIPSFNGTHEIYHPNSIGRSRSLNDPIDGLQQVIWLKEDLQANQKKWTVVTFHVPPFSTIGHIPSADPANQDFDMMRISEKLMPILEMPEYHVDAVLVSHSHAYLRAGMIRKIGSGPRTTDYEQTGGLGGNGNLGRYPTTAPYIKTNKETAYTYVVTGSAGRGTHGFVTPLNGTDKIFVDDSGYDDNNPDIVKKVDASTPKLDNLTGGQTTKFYHEFGGSVELLFRENRLDVTFIKEPVDRPKSANDKKFVVADSFVVMKDVNIKADYTLNPGEEKNLKASWVGDYFWYSSAAPSQILSTERELKVSPSVPTTYYVRDKQANGHLEDTFNFTSCPTPPPAPVLTANPSSIPPGGSSTLTASGCAGTVTWSHGPATGTSRVVSPASTTTYTATCTANGCTGPQGSVTVTVEPGPGETVCTLQGDQCSGNSSEVKTYTLTLASGGSLPVRLTYRAHEGPGGGRMRINGGSWQTFDLPQTPGDLSYLERAIGDFTFTAGNNTVELASGGGYICFRKLCVGSSVVDCNFAASANPSTINAAPGGTVTLASSCTGSGCAGVSYQWSGTGASCATPGCTITAPTTPGPHVYTVTLSKAGCNNQTAQVAVNVANNCPPAPVLTANPSSIPPGGGSTLTASGCAGTVTWSHGPATGTSRVVSPASTTTYTATCTASGCTGPQGSVTVTVEPGPGETVCTLQGDQCSGNSSEVKTYTLTLASGGSLPVRLTYRAHEGPGGGRMRINGGSWQTFDLPQTPGDLSYLERAIGDFTFTAGNNTVELASGGGYICFRKLCVGSSVVDCNFAASANPSTINAAPGGTVTLASSCTGSGCSGVSYQWSGTGASCATPGCTITAPTTPGPHVYTVTLSKSGCNSQTAQVAVNVANNCPPAPVLTANPSSIPPGGGSTLTASGCAGTVTWSHGPATGTSRVVSPASTTTYTATCTASGCTGPQGSVTVTVEPGPGETVCTLQGDQCSGNSSEVKTYTLTLASGGSLPVRLTYRAHEGPGGGRMRINGGSWQTFDLPQTPGDLSYLERAIGDFTFTAGNNTVELASGGGYICFRKLCVGSSVVDCNFAASANPSTINAAPGGTVTLASSCTGSGCAGVSYQWSGPGASCATPGCTITAPTTPGPHVYTVTLSKSGCNNQTAQVTVTVTSQPPVGKCIVLGDQCSGNSSEIKTYTLDLPSGGAFPVRLTYRAHEGPGGGRMRINGGSWQTFDLPQTPGDLSYVERAIGSFTFIAGNNTVELASGGGYICFRQLCVGNDATRIGVAELSVSEGKDLLVSPNPNNGEFEANFYVEKGRKAELKVTDMQGREVWQKSLRGIGEQREVIRLPIQSVGSYILLLQKEATPTTSRVQYKKVIVVK